jgi:uncharacterized protein (TIGR01627 family)
VKTLIKKTIRRFLAIPSAELIKLWPSPRLISVIRKISGIQLSAEQLHVIVGALKDRPRCRLLVFGLGNDSVLWSVLNRGGVTVFLEDDEPWFREVTRRSRCLTAFLVNYATRRGDWKRFLDSPASLEMTLPNDLQNQGWDIILVDGPRGDGDQFPGRMRSIYLASKLVSNAGEVFVHDCEREVEGAYCQAFLGSQNLRAEVKDRFGYLRHYHVTGRCH